MRSRAIFAKIISANPLVTDVLTASTKTYQKIFFEGIGSTYGKVKAL
jgi:hypothetical protein